MRWKNGLVYSKEQIKLWEKVMDMREFIFDETNYLNLGVMDIRTCQDIFIEISAELLNVLETQAWLKMDDAIEKAFKTAIKTEIQEKRHWEDIVFFYNIWPVAWNKCFRGRSRINFNIDKYIKESHRETK